MISNLLASLTMRDNATEESIKINFRKVFGTSLKWFSPYDEIFTEMCDLYKQGKFATVEYWDIWKVGQRSVDLDRVLGEIRELPFCDGAAFDLLLKESVYICEKKNIHGLLQGASVIAGEKKDIQTAYQKLTDGIRDFYSRSADKEAREFTKIDWEGRLTRWEENKDASQGISSGIAAIDTLTKGAKPGELLLICGFTSDGKSTLALYYAYQAALNGKRVMYYSLEMPAEVVEKMILTMHCNSPAYKQYGIVYDAIDSMMLSVDQRDAVGKAAQELRNMPGEFILKSPTDKLSWDDIEAEVTEESLRNGVDLLIVDYFSLLYPKKNDFGIYMNNTEYWNYVLKRMKAFAGVCAGKGLAIISPIQVNRDGRDYARKNNGEYRLDHIYQFSEGEKSADKVVTIYTDPDLRTCNEARVGVIKQRRGECRICMTIYANMKTCCFGDLGEDGGARPVLDMSAVPSFADFVGAQND